MTDRGLLFPPSSSKLFILMKNSVSLYYDDRCRHLGAATARNSTAGTYCRLGYEFDRVEAASGTLWAANQVPFLFCRLMAMSHWVLEMPTGQRRAAKVRLANGPDRVRITHELTRMVMRELVLYTMLCYLSRQ